MNLTTMSVAELNELQKEVTVALNAKANQTQQARVQEMLSTKQGQQLLKRYKEVIAACEDYRYGKSIKIKMLLSVELEADISINSYALDNGNYDSDDLFDVAISGTVLKTKGLSREQLDDLNYGLQETLNNACENKIRLFPGLQDELGGISDRLKEVEETLEEHHLKITDLVEDKPKKKR